MVQTGVEATPPGGCEAAPYGASQLYLRDSRGQEGEVSSRDGTLITVLPESGIPRPGTSGAVVHMRGTGLTRIRVSGIEGKWKYDLYGGATQGRQVIRRSFVELRLSRLNTTEDGVRPARFCRKAGVQHMINWVPPAVISTKPSQHLGSDTHSLITQSEPLSPRGPSSTSHPTPQAPYVGQTRRRTTTCSG